jgi:hypothetical protein
VLGNGGLIVTCLLDELPSSAILGLQGAGGAGQGLAELVARFEWRSSPLAAVQPPPSLKANGCPDHVFAFLQQELAL